MKKQMVWALAVLLLMPVVVMAGGFIAAHINPEIAAGHANYTRNFRLLVLAKGAIFLGGAAMAGVLWLVACFLVIRSKQQSLWWMPAAALGPFGFAVLAMLDDRAPAERDRYARFLLGMNFFLRVGYEALTFVAILTLAYEAMVVLRNLIILGQAAATGMSRAQIIDLQNASGGMWAFAEGNEILFMIALFYLLRPIAFNIAGRVAGTENRKAGGMKSAAT